MTSSSVCDPCSETSHLVCGKCKDAHYCGVEHHPMMWRYHKHICGHPSTSFRQPDITTVEYALFEKTIEEIPDAMGEAGQRHTLVCRVLSERCLGDKRNAMYSYLRQKIQFGLSSRRGDFEKYVEEHYLRMPFYQVADMELNMKSYRRNHEFVKLLFYFACLQEIARDYPDLATFTHRKKLAIRMDKVLEEWGPQIQVVNEIELPYRTRLELLRKRLESQHFQKIGGMNEKERGEFLDRHARSIGVKPRNEMGLVVYLQIFVYIVFITREQRNDSSPAKFSQSNSSNR